MISKDISEDIWWQSLFGCQPQNVERTTFITQMNKHFDYFPKGLEDLFV